MERHPGEIIFGAEWSSDLGVTSGWSSLVAGLIKVGERQSFRLDWDQVVRTHLRSKLYGDSLPDTIIRYFAKPFPFAKYMGRVVRRQATRVELMVEKTSLYTSNRRRLNVPLRRIDVHWASYRAWQGCCEGRPVPVPSPGITLRPNDADSRYSSRDQPGRRTS